MEWSVLNPGIISAWVILQIEDWLTRKKSSLQWMSGCRWRQVYLVASGLRILHASDNSRLSERSCTTFKAFLCVFARPPFLSLLRSSTKLKSPPIIISSQWKLDKWSKKARKKFGSSSLGAYMLAKVKGELRGKNELFSCKRSDIFLEISYSC